MKKSLAKILILVLILTMMMPAAANAASKYTITVTITDGSDKSVTTDPVNESAAATMVSAVGAKMTAKTDELREKFPGSPLADAFYQLNSEAGYWSTFWTTYGDDVTVSINDEEEAAEVKNTLISNRDVTVGELAAHTDSSYQLHLFYSSGAVNYEVILTFAPYTAGGGGGGGMVTPTPTPTPSAEPAEEEPIVVDASDLTEDEPLTAETEVADSAEEAQEIVVENIPEEVKEMDVEIGLNAQEDQEISDNTTVLAVKDKDGNVTIIPMAIVEVDEDGNITAKGSLNEELTEILKDGGSLIAYDNEQEVFEDVKEALETGDITQEEADAIAYWQAREVVKGEGDGNLGGLDQEVGRPRFVTLLHRAFGAPAPEAAADYADLDNEKYGYAKDAATWAAEMGLMNGIGMNDDGDYEFGTGEIAQWQMALVMFRAVGNSDEYPYEAAWTWAVNNGLISGDREASPDMPGLCLIMQRFAELLDGSRIKGDETLETPALEE
jgi:hypothetical protein